MTHTGRSGGIGRWQGGTVIRRAAWAAVTCAAAAVAGAGLVPNTAGAPGSAEGVRTPVDDGLSARLTALAEKLEKRREELHIPGMALVVIKDGKPVLARGFGVRDIVTKTPVDADTVFGIGSSTKAFTSALVAMMVDEKKLSWDEPVRTYVPGFKLSDPAADAGATLIDVMSHRTGLSRTDMMWGSGLASREDMLAALGRAKPKGEFRKVWNYNNVMFMVAGDAAARASGSTWEDLIRTRIFKPLGMKNSDVSVAELLATANYAKGYAWEEENKEFTELPPHDTRCVAPAGAINSSVNDMARWVMLQLGRGELDGVRIVSRENLEKTWEKQIDMTPDAGYGMGWMLHTWQGKRVVEHGGNIDGYAAEVAMLPDDNAGFVLLCSVTFSQLAGEAQNQVWEALFPTKSTGSELSEGQLAEYVGAYHFDTLGVDCQALIKEGKLALDVPGQTVYELRWPDADGKWEFALTDTIKVRFDRGDDGKINSITLFQAGMKFKLPRVDPKSKKGPEGALAKNAMTREQLRPYTGTYHFAPRNEDWKVFVKDGRLVADVPKQAAFVLKWPDDKARWVFELTEAISLEFVKSADGAITGLKCYQGGMTFDLPRTAPGDEADLPTLAEMMALREKAISAEKVAALGMTRVKGTVNFENQGVSGTMIMLWSPDGRFSQEMDFGVFGRVRQVCDGKSVWIETTTQPAKEVFGEERDAVIETAKTGGTGLLPSLYEKIEVERSETIEGKKLVVVAGTSKSGKRTVRQFCDTQTGLPFKEESVTNVTGVGPIPSKTFYDEWTEVKGVTMPRRMHTEDNFQGIMRLEIESYETGVALPEDVFAPPAIKGAAPARNHGAAKVSS